MKLDFGNGFSLSLWQDEIKALEVKDGQIILTTPTGRVITLKIPNINPKDQGVSRFETLETSLPPQEATEPPSPTGSTRSTRSTTRSENLDPTEKKEVNTDMKDMIDKLRKEVESFKQDAMAKYQEVRHIHNSLGARQKRVEKGNTETTTEMINFKELVYALESRVTAQGDNLTTMAENVTGFLQSLETGELHIFEDRPDRKGKAK